MRDDLLDAQASVDWAVSQLPAFAKRLSDWLGLNVNVGVEDVPPPATHNPIVAIEKEPLPLAFNVEMGAYINAIRSSLDILAGALANRYDIPRLDEAYFPVAPSEAAFLSGDYKGVKFVKGLPDAERGFIETLKPYKGGNKPLWALHRLDIIRKHQRLLSAEINPERLSLTNLSIIGGKPPLPPPADFVPVATGWLRVNEKTVLGLIRKGAPNYEMKFIPYIAINEPGLIAHKPVITILDDLARHASAIINLFDGP